MKTDALQKSLAILAEHDYDATASAAADELKALEGRVRALEDALRPFALFAERFDANPLRGISDTLYGIHGGCEGKEAELRLSDCRNARAALVGETP